jgi:hypothetical protein
LILQNGPSAAQLRLQAQQPQALQGQQAAALAHPRSPIARLVEELSPLESQLLGLKLQIATPQSPPVATTMTGIPGTATSGSTTIFLHQRANDAGAKRLVAITADPTHLYLSLYTLAGVQSPPQLLLRQTITRDRALSAAKVRFYAGQIDPSDPRRFTIRMEIADRTGTITGTLRNDGMIDLAMPGWLDDGNWLPQGIDFDPLTWRGTASKIAVAVASTSAPGTKFAVTFPDNNHVAVATAGTIEIIDLTVKSSATLKIERSNLSEPLPTRLVAFSRDGSKLLLWHYIRSQMVDTLTGKTMWEVPMGFPTSDGSIPLTFSTDGSQLLVKELSIGGTVLVAYDAQTGRRLASLYEQPLGEVFLNRPILDAATESIFTLDWRNIYRYRDGAFTSQPHIATRMAAAADRLNLVGLTSIEVFSTRSFTTLETINFTARPFAPGTDPVIAISRDGRRIVFTNPSAAFVAAPEAGFVIQIPFTASNPAPAADGLIGAISPDNQRIALLTNNGELFLYDLSKDVDPPMAKLKP